MNRSIIIGVFVLCLVSIVVALVYVKKRDSVEINMEPVEAPEFSLPDAQGNIISLTDVTSNIRIINFWASWSPYSKDELNALTTLKEEYGDEIEIIALSRDHNREDAKMFVKNNEIKDNITFVYDTEDEYFGLVEGYAVPETLFLNSKGEIVYHEHKPLTYDEIKEHIYLMLQN